MTAVGINEMRARFFIEGELKEGRAPEVEWQDESQVRCPACKSLVTFFSTPKKLECENCGLLFPVVNTNKQGRAKPDGDWQEVQVYQCPECGPIAAEDVFEDSSGMTCQHCGNQGLQPLPGTTTPRRKRSRKSMKDAIMEDKKSKFTMSDDDKDAELNFGQFRGHRLSNMVKDKRGRGYMTWMLEQSFPDYLKDAIRHQLEDADDDDMDTPF